MMASPIFRRFRSLLLAAAVGALSIPGLFSVALPEDTRIVRPNTDPGPAFDQSDTPIETTLHKYDRKAVDKYLTTGESITFRFPAAYYYYRHDNQQGGPQYEIRLALDHRDLGAIVPKLRELERPPMTDDQIPEREKIRKRWNFVTILSSLALYQTPLFKIDKGNYRFVGSYCELSMYVSFDDRARQGEIRQSLTPIPYPFLQADTFVSEERVDNDRFDNDYYFKATCSPTVTVPTCVADTYLEDWPISFQIPKERLCSWRAELKRIQEFLSSHVVQRTRAREEVR